MKKVLVTGGAGYIGSVLVRKLLEDGYAVTVIDNFMYDNVSALEGVKDNENVTIISGDARDEGLMREHAAGKDFLIPLAALVGAPICDKYPDEAREINLEAIKMLLQIRRPEQGILFPNTNSGYGYMEEGTSYCDETSPLHPVSLYGELKVAAERAILHAGGAVTFRLATVFGMSPRMRLDLLVNDFVWTAVKVGKLELFEPHFKRNYIHIRDVAKAFTHAMENFDDTKNEVYNVGLSDANLSKLELCEEIKRQVPEFEFTISEKGKDPDRRDYIVSNEKIEKTGFVPDVSLQDGIRELIEGYKHIDSREGLTNI